MPISKSEFNAALTLQDDADLAHQESQAKRQAAKAGRASLATLIASWGGLDASDPFTVRLVEHEGAVYRVSPTDIKVLSTETTT